MIMSHRTSSPFFLEKIFLSGLFFLLVSFSGSFAQSTSYKALLNVLYDKDFPTIKPEEITSLDAYQVLDTREKEEYEVSHLSDAVWTGFDTFSLSNLDSLDKGKPVLVYCTVGARSQEIGMKLREAGFTQVYNLYGGIINWANLKKPLMRGDKQTNQVHTYSKSWGIWLKEGEKVYD